MTSILPANLAELERDIDAALDRFGEIKVDTATIWNPWTCPPAVLPFLAWALSVDQWRSAWPLEQKRRIVAQSLDLHRIKGTRRAVDLAVAGFGLNVRITEWFEAVPEMPRGTFRVDIYSADQPVSEGLSTQLKTAIESAKRKSQHLTGFSLNLQSRAVARLGCAAVTGETIRVYPYQPQDIAAVSLVRLAVGARLQEVVKVYPGG
jgi:phage tail P2-like protein